MAILLEKFRHWLRDNSGATAIEYSLIAAGISIAIAVIVYTLGDTIYELMYSRLPDAFN